MDRYARQIAFPKIGNDGQKKLLASRIAVVGMGALGTVSASQLARAGIGFLRLIDRDHVEITNLQRQMLYTEQDAADEVPKAIAAADRLKEANSGIEIEPMLVDLNSGNADALLADVDLVVDASDNFEVRLLINETCKHHHIPWIYGAAIQSRGMTMNFLGGEQDPCFCCVLQNNHITTDPRQTCSSAGVLGMITSIIASLQAVEAIKILTGSDEVRKDLLQIDAWSGQIHHLSFHQWEECPVCAGNYSYYGKVAGSQITSLCGRDVMQVVPAHPAQVDFDQYAARLGRLGKVKQSRFALDYDNGEIGFKLFPDGRALIRHVHDEGRAKSIYAEYIGL